MILAQRRWHKKSQSDCASHQNQVRRIKLGKDFVRIGVVAFGDTAEVLQELTEDKIKVDAWLGKAARKQEGSELAPALLVAKKLFESSSNSKTKVKRDAVIALFTDGQVHAAKSADPQCETGQDTPRVLAFASTSSNKVSPGLEAAVSYPRKQNLFVSSRFRDMSPQRIMQRLCPKLVDI